MNDGELSNPRDQRPEVVLVGGGHAHVQVLRGLVTKPIPNVRLTLLVDQPGALYSGMVPGVISGQYTREEATIDLRPLAARAGARLVIGKAVRVDAGAGHIELAGGNFLHYEYASLNVGSVARGPEGQDSPAHAIATRPISELVSRLELALAKLSRETRPSKVCVVGAGAAGVELACAIAARLGATDGGHRIHEVSLIGGGGRPLPGATTRALSRVQAALGRHHIAFCGNTRVRAVDASALTTASGVRLPSDLTIWATGAAAPPVIRDSELPHDARGFVRTDQHLLVEGCSNLFAAGDCATLASAPEKERAGVYAVRAGPILLANLRRRLAGRPLESHRPQSDYLRLLNLADGTALGSKWGLALQGRSVAWLKDRIDRGFVSRFRFDD